MFYDPCFVNYKQHRIILWNPYSWFGCLSYSCSNS